MKKEAHCCSTFIEHNPAALPPRKRLKSLGSSSPPSTPTTPPLKPLEDKGTKRKIFEATERVNQKELFTFSREQQLPHKALFKEVNVSRSEHRNGRKPGSSSRKAIKKNKKDVTLYCLCRQPYEEEVFMIACDVCDDWFHGKCVGVTERKAQTLKTYVCPPCSNRGPTGQKRSVVKADEDVEVNVEDEDEEMDEELERLRATKRRKRTNQEGIVELTALKLGRLRNSPNSRGSASILGDADGTFYVAGETDSSKDDDLTTRRICVNEGCNNQAKPRSKYCSTKCGVQVATRFLEKQKSATSKPTRTPLHRSESPPNRNDSEDNFSSIKRLLESSPDISAADDSDLRLLESLERQRTEAERNLTRLVSKREQFEKTVRFSMTLFATSSKDPGNNKKEVNQQNETSESSSRADDIDNNSQRAALEGVELMDCFSCGQPIAGRLFARHIEQCYAKKGSSPHKLPSCTNGDNSTTVYCNYYDQQTASYCAYPLNSCPLHAVNQGETRKERLCGCPTGDFGSGYCERTKKECLKHFNWENIRQMEMELEKKRQKQVLSSLNAEIELVKARIRRRSQAKDDTHRTIAENPAT